jgi:RND family efflux transporter MFP subunit
MSHVAIARRLAAAHCLLVGLLMGVLTAGCAKEPPEEVESETVVPVSTEQATMGTIRAVLHATGTVAPAPGGDLIVVAPETARIAEIPKAEGDRVRQGDLLVRFEIPALTAGAAGKRAEVARAQATLEQTTAAHTRAVNLFERGVAARKDVEETERARKEAEATLTDARAAETAAQRLATRTEVHAPFSGVVAKRSHNPGDVVEPGGADPILRVVDPSRLQVMAMIPMADVPRTVIGADAHLVDATGVPLAALKVVSIPAAIEPGTASASVRLTFAGPAGYPVGAPVEVSINAESHKDVVLVPTAAIVREGEDTFVFVTDGKKAQRRPVTVGVTDAEHAEIRSGLKAGEPVITRGQAGLPDGASVTVSPAPDSDSK